jgi:hypothetical protein
LLGLGSFVDLGKFPLKKGGGFGGFQIRGCMMMNRGQKMYEI